MIDKVYSEGRTEGAGEVHGQIVITDASPPAGLRADIDDECN